MLGELRYWQATRRYLWKQYFFTGEWELRELPRYVDKHLAAIDVGANDGIYSYHLSRLARWVHAFEPNAERVAHIRSLGVARLSLENVALSSSAGVAMLRFPKDGSGGESVGMASLENRAVADETLSRVAAVQTRRLDDYDFGKIGFIKIDVEGHEEAVLDGARTTIARDRPTLLIEIEERHNPGALVRISAELAALGYEGFYFDRGLRRPLNQFSAARDQIVTESLHTAAHNRRRLPYINNFLFSAR